MFFLWITIRKKNTSTVWVQFVNPDFDSSYQRQVELNCSVVPFEAKLWGETVGRKFRPTVSPLVINVRVLFLSIFSLVYFNCRLRCTACPVIRCGEAGFEPELPPTASTRASTRKTIRGILELCTYCSSPDCIQRQIDGSMYFQP